MRSKKGMSGAAIVVVVVATGVGLLTGQLSVEDLTGELLEGGSGSGSAITSNGSSMGDDSSNVASSPATGSSQVGGAPALSAAEAEQALAGLTVSDAGSMTGYSREDYDHWESAEDYGWQLPVGTADAGSCDARAATLIRDGSQVKAGEYCTVDSGRWADPFTGQTLTDPSDLDVDHVVPLANAHRSGAGSWSAETRAEYANAPIVLAAVDDSENQSKGDQGPEAWEPSYEGSHCAYGARWVQIKEEWGLTVTGEERSALQQMLSGCAA